MYSVHMLSAILSLSTAIGSSNILSTHTFIMIIGNTQYSIHFGNNRLHVWKRLIGIFQVQNIWVSYLVKLQIFFGEVMVRAYLIMQGLLLYHPTTITFFTREKQFWRHDLIGALPARLKDYNIDENTHQ